MHLSLFGTSGWLNMLTFCEDSLILRGIGMIKAMGIPIKQPLYRSFGSSIGALGSTLC